MNLELLTGFLYAESCLGMEETGSGVVAYFPAGDRNRVESLLSRIADHFPSLEIQTELYRNQDWVAVFNASLAPVILEPFYVTPDPERFPPPPHLKPLFLKPGAAFGTGHHASTGLVLRLLSELSLQGRRVLDLGCGSGILSIAAAALGALQVVAVDIDPDSVFECRRNGSLNSTSFHTVIGTEASIRSSFDLLLANLLPLPLRSILPEAFRWVRPGGDLIISGVEAGDKDFFTFLDRQKHLEILSRRIEGGWAAWHLNLFPSSS
ncbi:MAG TPA: 50S ribosomal protein L11 methyltransferase [Thermoanaerobaculia bacterium]|mgnify:CR=1 FL=1|nr:50S ribosomal protein L11 methyltransferase [Thermoanaerobaculia bacterium]HUM29401.1 50S ribosomal protein L11 methyltransferase [Thermoanaerobaculia bacterium]HXK67647.1 50S ribosomal protein L11 methyltransferase [Thermoanaerobaculia bacterium]